MMQDSFSGKTWIQWLRLVGCGGLGLFSVGFGVLFVSGVMTDVRGEVRTEAGPPMLIVGCGMLVVTVMAACNIAALASPIIRCYREGIECNLVGATSLDGVSLLPGLVRVAWAILSLQGFRSQRVRIPWPEFGGASVGGIPMAYVLTLSGECENLKDGRVVRSIAFAQVTLVDHPEHVAAALNDFAADASQRHSLSNWPE